MGESDAGKGKVVVGGDFCLVSGGRVHASDKYKKKEA